MLQSVSCAAPLFQAITDALTWQNALIAILVVIIGLAIWALLVMILWNLVIPAIFPGVHCITFWEALGLGILLSLLL